MNMFYLILLIFIAIPNQLFGLGEGLGGHEGEDRFVLIDHSDAPTEPLHFHHDAPAKSHTDLITTNPHDRTSPPVERVISDIPVDGGDNGTVKVDNSGNDGSSSVVVDPTTAKDVIADVDGGNTISGSASDIPDRVIGTHQAIHAHLFIEEKKMPDLSFDIFLQKFQNDPATLDTYIQTINDSQEALTALKHRADVSGDTTDAQKCEELLEKLKNAKKEIQEFKEKLNTAAPELATLTKEMSNPKYKFRAKDLTKLTKLFDDSLNTDDPLVGNYIRSRVKSLMETIIKNNKGLGRFQRSSLRSMVESMNKVITFLVSLHSNTLTDNEIDLRLYILSKELNAKSKTGSLGYSKIRKTWLKELQQKLSNEIAAKKIKAPKPTESRPEKHKVLNIKDIPYVFVDKTTKPQTLEQPTTVRSYEVATRSRPEKENPSTATKDIVEQTTGKLKTTTVRSYEVTTGSRPEKINPAIATADVTETTGQQKALEQPTTAHSRLIKPDVEPVQIERKKGKTKTQKAAEQAAQKAAAAKAIEQAQADQAAAQEAEALAAANKDNTVDAAKAKLEEERALFAKQEAARATAAALKAQQQVAAAATAAPSVVEPAPLYTETQLKAAKIIVNLHKTDPAKATKSIAKTYSSDVAAALIKELLPGQKMPEPKKSILNKIGLKK